MALTEVNSLGIKDLEVKTADIAAANVTLAKVADVTSAQIIVGNGSNRPTAVAVSGDVTLANTGAVTIATGAVEHAMLANDCVDADNIDDNAVGLAAMAGIARGKLIVGDSNGDPAYLNAGSNDHVLTMDANGDVGWEAAAGGGITREVSNGSRNIAGPATAGDEITADGNDNTLFGYDAGTSITSGDNQTAVGSYALAANATGSNATAVGFEALRYATGNNTAFGSYALKGVSGDVGAVRNIAVGHQAAMSITSGDDNTVVGNTAGYSLTTGGTNTAVGSGALGACNTGGNNVAVGFEALDDLTSSSYNVAIGTRAAKDVTTSDGHTVIGYEAFQTASTGGGSTTAVGWRALGSATTGYSNVGVGYEALQECNTGYMNVAVGKECAQRITSGDYNTCIGTYAGNNITLGNRNVAIGPYAAGSGSVDLSKHDNICIGYEAGAALTTADYVVMIGTSAGKSTSSGDWNTFIGHEAGYATVANTTGDKNTILGARSRCDANNRYNCTVIGFQETGIANNNTWFAGGDGWYNRGNNSSWTTTSDQRIKKNIVAKDTGLAIINQLNVKEYDYKTQAEIETDNPEFTGQNVAIPERLAESGTPTENEDGSLSLPTRERGKVIGLIAQELEAVLPNSVITHANTIKTIDKDDLFWYMLNAIKELSTKVTALENA